MPARPKLISLTPSSGEVGQVIQIAGNQFSKNPPENQVRFNGIPAAVTTATKSQLTVPVPGGATTGDVRVVVRGLEAQNTLPFTVIVSQPPIEPPVEPPEPPTGERPQIGGVGIFPSSNVWNTPVDALPVQRPVDPINDHGGHNLHPDFGTTYNGLFNGIPVNVVAGSTVPKVRVNITIYASESDLLPEGNNTTGLLPIPADVKIESDPPSAPAWDSGADNHLLLIDSETRVLHELYNAIRQPDGSITAKHYCRWDLGSNALRQAGWTSSDAAGLPVTPGLILYDQVADALAVDPTGATVDVGHALRFTLDLTHGPYLWPARHDANSGGTQHPPFGMRVRLKANFNTSGFSPINRVILNTLKKYGALLADNGGDWFFQGAPDTRWNDDDLHALVDIIPANHMEVVDTQHWIVTPDSGEANMSGVPIPPPVDPPPVEPPTEPPPVGNLALSSTSDTVTVQAGSEFRLVFEKQDNWGLSQWYDLLHDPAAQTNLIGPAWGVNHGDDTQAQPGLFNQVWYGTVPNDPVLFMRSIHYYFPNTTRTLEILENTAQRVVIRSTSHPVASSIGVLSNVTVRVTYTIHPDGRIYVHSEMTAAGSQTISTWFNSIMGLQNPGHTGSIPPDTRGWVRATEEQNPYQYTVETSRYVFAYWHPSTPAPYTDWAKASILLVPAAGNPHQGKQQIHSWVNFTRWGYGSENISMQPGQTITQDYLIQLGSRGSSVLPDITSAAVAGPIADAYLGN